jgi:hypothetical protein
MFCRRFDSPLPIFLSFKDAHTLIISLLTVFDIVNDASLIPAGSCATNVNSAGSYLTDPNEYTFMVDYRIVPGLNFTSGYYQVVLHFCLVEQS